MFKKKSTNEPAEKKPIYKRGWFIGLIVILGLAAFGNWVGDEETANTTVEQTAAKEEPPKKEPKLEKFDFSNAEITEENVKKAIEPILGSADEIIVKVDDEGIYITEYQKQILSERSIVKQSTRNAVQIGKELYSNPKTNEVWYSLESILMDKKGAEERGQLIGVSFNRESIDGVNWDNMISMVSNDPMKVQNIAQSYLLLPFLQEALKK